MSDLTTKEKILAANDIIGGNDIFAGRIGDQLADLFKLKRDPEHKKDRFKTTEGSRTSAGVARVVFRLLDETGFDFITDKGDYKVEESALVGGRIVDIFNLKKDKQYADRFETSVGTKTYLGLAATSVRIIAEEVDNMPNEYVIQSKSEQGFWANEQGWVCDVESATKYKALDINQSPGLVIGDAEWIHIDKAVDFDLDNSRSPS